MAIKSILVFTTAIILFYALVLNELIQVAHALLIK